MKLFLVYQGGIANIFEENSGRIRQDAFGPCEYFCQGAQYAGAKIEIYHCEKAGNILDEEWELGPGSLFKESKNYKGLI